VYLNSINCPLSAEISLSKIVLIWVLLSLLP